MSKAELKALYGYNPEAESKPHKWGRVKKHNPGTHNERKKPAHRESNLQQACVKWFKLAYPKKVIFSIPNEGMRQKANASRLKAEGMLAGVSDIFIMEPVGKYHGLWVELKIPPNTPTKSQSDFIRKADERDYANWVCYSFDQFKENVEIYLNGKY